MSPLVLFIATAALGIDVGWEPLPDGGHEYTIQIEPNLLDVLKREKDEIVSEVPPQVHIRHFRIIAGSGLLPQIDGPAAGHEPAHDPAARRAPAGAAEARPGEHDRSDSEHEAAVAAHDQPPATAPAELPPASAGSAPLGARQAGFDLPGDKGSSTPIDANKPTLEEEARPWMPLAVAGLLLCCSLGANLYLGWIAWDARTRYRSAVAKLRTAPAS